MEEHFDWEHGTRHMQIGNQIEEKTPPMEDSEDETTEVEKSIKDAFLYFVQEEFL